MRTHARARTRPRVQECHDEHSVVPNRLSVTNVSGELLFRVLRVAAQARQRHQRATGRLQLLLLLGACAMDFFFTEMGIGMCVDVRVCRHVRRQVCRPVYKQG